MPPPITKELLEKRAASVRLGGKGSVRRTVKTIHKVSADDDKKLQGTLKKLGTTPLAEIESALFIRQDQSVWSFKNPKVQANFQIHCYVIHGSYETKKFVDMLPELLSSLGVESRDALAKAAQAPPAGVPAS